MHRPVSLVDASVWRDRARLAGKFRDATPFRHVIIDGFFEAETCRRLLAEFPRFEDRYALNEMGQVGRKAVRTSVADISEAYRAADRYIQTPEFLGLISEITGIPALLYDADYVGGGTHESLQSQRLEPHVDFNYHPVTGWHRRLNLIVYLNPQWEESWGGCLELHSDPWKPGVNQVTRVLPLFNRCVIFETNEVSWHSFSKLTLPTERAGLSRKSFAIYLYTRERPATEATASHATVYVPEARPEGVRAGVTLTPEMVAELDDRFGHLHGHLKFLYDREKQFTAHIAILEAALAKARAAARIPLQGYATQSASARGYWLDAWCGQELEFAFTPVRAARGFELEVWPPPELTHDQSLALRVGESSSSARLRPGLPGSISVSCNLPAGREVRVEVRAASTWSPKAAGKSGDDRHLAYRLIAARLTH